MRYNHFSMLPERAFQPRNGLFGMTLEGGGGGPTTSTTYTSNIPDYLRPQVESLIGGATQEYFNTTPVTTTDPITGEQKTIYQISGVKPFVPYSTNVQDYVAGFSPLQQQTQFEAAGMQRPGQYGMGSQFAGQAGMGGAESAQQAYGYGGMGAGYGAEAAGIGQRGLGYQGYGADIGQQAMGYGRQAAGMGGLYEQMATSPGAMQAYMSPYTQNVVDLQKEAAIRDAQKTNLAANLGAVRQGTYGGARQLLAQTERERALGSQLQNIQAQGLQDAYRQAQQAQQFGITAGLQGLQGAQQGLGTALQGGQLGLSGIDRAIAGQQAAMQGAGIGLQGVTGAQAGYGLLGQSGVNLANIGTAQQAADINRMELQSRLGGEQQAREQQMINQAIQNYQMAREYPYEQLSRYSGLLRGYYTPTTTASTYQAAPNAASQVTGAALAAAGALKKKGGAIKEKKYAEGGLTDIDQKVLRNPTSFPPEVINKGMQNDSLNDAIGAIALSKIADAKKQTQMQQGLAGGAPQGTILAELQQAAMAPGIDGLPSNLPPQGMAGGGIVAFSNGGKSQMESDQAAMIDTLKRMGYSAADIATMIPRGVMGAFNTGIVRPARAITGMDIPYAKDILAPEGSDFTSMTPFYDKLRGSKAPELKNLPQSQATYVDESKRGTASYGKDSGIAAQLRDLQLANARRDAEAPPVRAAAAAPAVEPKQEPAEDMLAKRKRMLKEAGVSEDPFAEDRAANKAMKEQINKDREKAFNMALIEAGLGIMGGTSPHFAQNIAQAKGAIGSYAKSIRDIKADEKEYAKIDRDLRRSEDALKRGDVDKALEYEDKAQQRQIQLRGVQAQERAAGRPTSTGELLAALQSSDPKVRGAAERFLGSAKMGQVDERFLRDQWSKMKPLDKMLLERQGIKSFEQWAASQGYPIGGGGGGGFRVLGREGG
jgi:hypothetical protein